MAIRAHWITMDWKQETTLLDLPHIDGSHDGLKFGKLFIKCLEKFGIPFPKVMAVTCDNASSNDTFMTFLEQKSNSSVSSEKGRIRCLLHIMNLAVQDLLSSLDVPGAEEFEGADNEFRVIIFSK